MGLLPTAETDPQLHPSIPTFIFALPQPIQLFYPFKDFLPTNSKQSHLHLQKQALSKSSSSTHPAVHPPTIRLPPSTPAHRLPYLVLLLLSSTYSPVLLAYAMKSSSHPVVAPLHFPQSGQAALRVLPLHSFPVFVLYAVDKTRATLFRALHQQRLSKGPRWKLARFLTLALCWRCRD